jgi:hypothetical protein
MDDFTLGGPEAVVARDVQKILENGAAIGLHLNAAKCEIIHHPETTVKSDFLNTFVHVLPQDASLLGAPLFDGDILDMELQSCCDNLEKAIERLQSISAHDAVILLRSSFSAPKIMHILRCSPCVSHQALTFSILFCELVSVP